ncbi:hypothetical protein [Parafrankia soli]|nr:hypothetical protein [Parafrankia soli]
MLASETPAPTKIVANSLCGFKVPEALYWDSNRDTWKLISQHRRDSGHA